MAFESVLSRERRRPQRWRRAALLASLVIHGGVLAVGVVYSFWRVEDLPLPSVSVTLAAGPPPPPPPPPAARRSSSTPKTRPSQPKPETLVQPDQRPKEPPKPQEETKEEDGAEVGGVEGGVKGGVQGGVVGGVLGAPLPKDTGPRMISPQIAKGQLLIDPNDERYRVSLPPALARAGMRFAALLRLCVSAQGTVTEVRILRGADPAIDPQIPTVLGRWRYRPYQIDGRPVPFCYLLRYEISSR
jgi:protein TonB